MAPIELGAEAASQETVQPVPQQSSASPGIKAEADPRSDTTPPELGVETVSQETVHPVPQQPVASPGIKSDALVALVTADWRVLVAGETLAATVFAGAAVAKGSVLDGAEEVLTIPSLSEQAAIANRETTTHAFTR